VKLEADAVKIEDNDNNSHYTSKVKSLPDTLRRQPEAPKPQEEKEQDEPRSFFDLNFKSLATDGQ
jgi:hypothetical protein